MSKVSRGRRSAKTSAFRTIDKRHPRPEFPLEDAVERKVDHTDIGRRIRYLERRIVQGLGGESSLLWALEELRLQRERGLQVAFFEVGYNHGLADGQTYSLRRSLPQASAATQRVADEVRALIVSAGLTKPNAAAALLETAWTLLVEPQPAAKSG
jgi:hypothetical protein